MWQCDCLDMACPFVWHFLTPTLDSLPNKNNLFTVNPQFSATIQDTKLAKVDYPLVN